MSAGAAFAEPPLPVFVYGLLRPGGAGYLELGLGACTDWIGTDAVPGTLHDLGDYPGLVPGGGGTVHGEVLTLSGPDVLARLDAYELFDPADPAMSDYIRIRATTLRRGLNVWIYAYNRPIGDWPVIPDGEWLR